MGLPPPSTKQVTGKPSGPLQLLLGGLVMVAVMSGWFLLDLIKRLMR